MGEQNLSHKQRALSLDCLWGPAINAYQKVNTKQIGWLAGTRRHRAAPRLWSFLCLDVTPHTLRVTFTTYVTFLSDPAESFYS